MLSSYQSTPRVQYLFIDGAYLTGLLRELGQTYFGTELQLDYARFGGAFRKTFYYDSLPARKVGETDELFALRVERKERFFQSLRSLDGWHVNEGSSRRRGKERKTEQKEVDILIAVDMMKHAHRGNMEELTFVAGDLDFRPLLNALVDDGMYVRLWYGLRNTNRELVDAADAKQVIDMFWLYGYCTNAFCMEYRLPSRSRHSALDIGPRVHKTASVEGKDVAWLEQRMSQWILWVEDNGGRGGWLQYIHQEPEMLMKVFQLEHGDPVWR